MRNNYAHSVRCTVCRGAQVPAKLHTRKFHDRVITEAKYVCPKCGSLVKRCQVENRKVEK